jgi:prepilin-type N-terminal cleavage/methylation domain-containing protein/prepilin-type processing-associated H-X9-DG protein
MQNRRAFTLIELLVVISIIVLLMALLFPALSRARKQARAVVCQSRQRGWSVTFAAYQNDYDGRFPDRVQRVWDAQAGEWKYDHLSWPIQMELYARTELKDAMLCPTASKPVPADPSWRTRGTNVSGGATFLAWRLDSHWRADMELTSMPQYAYFGSYAMNSHLWTNNRSSLRTVGPGALPTFFDCRVTYACLQNAVENEPPPYEDFEMGGHSHVSSSQIVINRHQDGINMLFLDGAVRKVGVKQLWTLKWCEDFDTAGPWTKAGGVQPGDWPTWMQGLKEY